MKKRPKIKPRRQRGAGKLRPGAGARATSQRLVQRHAALLPTVAAVLGSPRDDRAAITMLMLPCVALALCLGSAQGLRRAVPALQTLASHARTDRAPPAPLLEPRRPPSPFEPRAEVPREAQSAPSSELARSAERPAPAAEPPQRPSRSEQALLAPLPDGGAGDSTDTVPRLPVPAESELASNDDASKDGPSVCLGPAAVTLPAENASDSESFGARLAAAALTQTRDLVIYTAKYRPIRYPMGDLAPLYGACTDVIIRAYRALGIDLQQLVHDARIGSGDTNVDHRRTEVLRRFFARRGASLPVTYYPEDYLPGDIVTYERPFSRVSRSHIAMVADALGPAGRPLIVHNRGWGPQLEDALFADRITGHYRFVPFSTPQEVRGEPSLASALSTSAGTRGGKFKVRTKAAGLVLPAPAGFAAKP